MLNRLRTLISTILQIQLTSGYLLYSQIAGHTPVLAGVQRPSLLASLAPVLVICDLQRNQDVSGPDVFRILEAAAGMRVVHRVGQRSVFFIVLVPVPKLCTFRRSFPRRFPPNSVRQSLVSQTAIDVVLDLGVALVGVRAVPAPAELLDFFKSGFFCHPAQDDRPLVTSFKSFFIPLVLEPLVVGHHQNGVRALLLLVHFLQNATKRHVCAA
jgi:hypothetical protein